MVWPLTVGSRPEQEGMMGQFDSFRKSKFLCDFVIETDSGEKFDVHKVVCARVSDWIEDELEKDPSVVRVPGTEASIVAKAIDWIYTGALVAENSLTLLKLIKVANDCRVGSLSDTCFEAFKNTCGLGDGLDCWHFADEQNLPSDVTSWCLKFVSSNFSDLEKPALLKMSFERLFLLLDQDCLDVSHEEQVWDAVKAWIEHDMTSRIECLVKLLKCVRLAHASRETFASIKEFYLSHLGVEEPASANRLLADAQYFFDNLSDITSGADVTLRGADLLRPRFPKQLMIVLLTHDTDNGPLWVGPPQKPMLFSYDVNAGLWYNIDIDEFPTDCRRLVSTVINQTEVILLAQRSWFDAPRIYALDINTHNLRELSTLNRPTSRTGMPTLLYHQGQLTACWENGFMEVYDQAANKWTFQRVLSERTAVDRAAMDGASFVSVKGRMYIIGGMNPNTAQSSSEIRYLNENTGSLTVKAEMLVGRFRPSCCEWNEKIVIAGGFSRFFSGSHQSVELFDPETNEVSSMPDITGVYAHGNSLLQLGRSGLIAMEGPIPNYNANRIFAVSRRKKSLAYSTSGNKWKMQAMLQLQDVYSVSGVAALDTRHALNSNCMFLEDGDRVEGFLKLLAIQSDDGNLTIEDPEDDEEDDGRATQYRDVLVANLFG